MRKKNRKGVAPIVVSAIIGAIAALAALGGLFYVKSQLNVSLWMSIVVVVVVLFLLRR